MPTRQEIQARAAEDPQFRQELKSNPRGTLERELGGTLPADIQIEVLEETAHRVYMVVPEAGSKELSSEELAGVAGGGCWIGTTDGCKFVTTTG
jgi:hypothetical protein